MEEHLLGVLRFELTVPTPKTFLRRFTQAAMSSGQVDARLEHLASYATELSLLEYGALQFLPSTIAAAAVLIAQYVLGKPVWSATLEHYTGYTPSQLGPAARLMFQAMRSARHSDTPATREKFATDRFAKVSLIQLPENMPSWLFQ